MSPFKAAGWDNPNIEAMDKEAIREFGEHGCCRRRTILNPKAIRDFIKDNGKYITQIESTFYTVLEVKVENMILAAITNNASRRRLTQYELVGNGNAKEVKHG